MTSLKEDEAIGVAYRTWKASPAKAVAVLVHGINSHSGRWRFLAEYLCKNGISSYAIELKGFGQAKGHRGRAESLKVYYDDLRRLRGLIAREDPGRKIFIIGESAGALIAFLMAIMEPRFFEGLICISPAFTGRLDLGLSDYLKIFLSGLYDPERQFVMPITSAMCTRDAGVQTILDAEFEVHKRITARLLVDIALAQVRCRIVKNKMRTPVLFLLAGTDALVDPAASRAIFNGLKVSDKKLIDYPGMHHSLSIDLGRESVFQDIVTWLGGRM